MEQVIQVDNVIVVKLNNRCMHCTIYMQYVVFRLSTFQIEQLKLLQNFENATFPLASMVKSKNVKINLASVTLKRIDES